MLGRILNLINIRQQLVWAFFVKTAANIVWKALDENSILSLFHLSGYIRSKRHRVGRKWLWSFHRGWGSTENRHPGEEAP